MSDEPSSSVRKGEPTFSYHLFISAQHFSPHPGASSDQDPTQSPFHPHSLLVEEMISSVSLLKDLLEGAAWSQAFPSPQASPGTSVCLLTWLMLQRELGSFSLAHATALALKASPD